MQRVKEWQAIRGRARIISSCCKQAAWEGSFFTPSVVVMTGLAESQPSMPFLALCWITSAWTGYKGHKHVLMHFYDVSAYNVPYKTQEMKSQTSREEPITLIMGMQFG
jgi:hypothetical protein